MIYKETKLGNFNTVTAEIMQDYSYGFSVLIYDQHYYWIEKIVPTLEKAKNIAENEFNKCLHELKTNGFK